MIEKIRKMDILEREVDCERCDGTGATEHDTSQYCDSSPQSEYRECEECGGCGTQIEEYEAI